MDTNLERENESKEQTHIRRLKDKIRKQTARANESLAEKQLRNKANATRMQHLRRRPEKEKFEIVSEWGELYAYGYCKNEDGKYYCQYFNIPEYIQAGIHAFKLWLTNTGIMCTKANGKMKLMTSMIYINGYKAVTLGKAEKYSSRVEECDGQLFKIVTHYIDCERCESSWAWPEYITLDVQYGPLSDDYISRVTEEKKTDDDPYQTLLPGMAIDFVSLTFEEDDMRKGGNLHGIATHAQSQSLSKTNKIKKK